MNEIVEKKGSFSNFEKIIFTQLLKHPNAELKHAMANLKDAWDMGKKFDAEKIKEKVVLKFNNLFSDDDTDGSSIVDSPVADPKYMAFLTEMKEMKESMQQSMQASSTFQTTAKRFNGTIEKWRMFKAFVKKVFRDGKWWWWFLKHKLEGMFDGLYVTHHHHHHPKITISSRLVKPSV